MRVSVGFDNQFYIVSQKLGEQRRSLKAMRAVDKATVIGRSKKWVTLKKSLDMFPKGLLETGKKISGEWRG